MRCRAMTLRNRNCRNDAKPREQFCTLHLWIQGRKATVLLIATIAVTILSTAYGMYRAVEGESVLEEIQGALEGLSRDELIEKRSFNAELVYEEELARKARSQYQHLKSDFFDKFSRLGKIFFLLQEFEEAASCYTIAASVDGSGYRSALRLGKMAFEMSRFKEARDRLQKPLEMLWKKQSALTSSEQLAFSEATPYLSYSLRNLGQFDEAKLWAQRGADVASRGRLHASVGFNLSALGLVFLSETRLEEALAQFVSCTLLRRSVIEPCPTFASRLI